MAKRILNMTAEEMTHATKSELIEAIAGSEGRVLASETIGITIPLLTDVTNAEFAASMGADLILLNMFDVQEPKIMALPEVEKEETVREPDVWSASIWNRWKKAMLPITKRPCGR